MIREASAPGRVNLLGEQIDHQGGTVLPVAIDRRVSAKYTPGREWRFSSRERAGEEWTRYARAVIDLLREAGFALQPGALEVTSTLPQGRGLASSAALEVAIAGALCDAGPFALARLCRRAEHERVGVPCGLMDQAAAACAVAGHALALDCARETFRQIPLPDLAILVFDSGVERSLDHTPYGERRVEAETPGTRAFRHVREEKARVLEGIERLSAGDLAGFGALLYESHASLRDLYRCSHPALDGFVEACRATPGVHGARLTGAGWGGCALAIARPGLSLPGCLSLRSDDGLRRATLTG